MNGDVERLGLVVAEVVARLKGSLPAEQVDGHALDRADVDEGVAGLGVEQVAGRHYLGVELLVVSQVFAAGALAVDLVNLVELQARLRLERSEGVDGLGRERPTVPQEENPPGHARLHQPVNLVHQGEGFAGAGGHGDQHLPLAAGDSPLHRGVGFNLVRTQERKLVRRGGEPGTGGFEVAGKHFLKGRGRVEGGDAA